MKALAALRKDMEFNKQLSSLLNTLKEIAVSQFKALEQRIKFYDEFFTTIDIFLEVLSTKELDHPFTAPKDRPQAVIAVTSDTGLVGGINMQVVNTAINELKKIPGKMIVVGDRGKIYAAESGIPYIAFSGIKDEERYSQAVQLRDYVLGKVLKGEFGHVKAVYAKPISFTIQRIETITFLPYTPEKEMAAGTNIHDMIAESSPGDMIEYVVYLWMARKLYDIFGLSRLSEFAARFAHLEDSSQKLKDMDKKLQLEYHHVRHELVDRNMREIFAARLLFNAKANR